MAILGRCVADRDCRLGHGYADRLYGVESGQGDERGHAIRADGDGVGGARERQAGPGRVRRHADASHGVAGDPRGLPIWREGDAPRRQARQRDVTCRGIGGQVEHREGVVGRPGDVGLPVVRRDRDRVRCVAHRDRRCRRHRRDVDDGHRITVLVDDVGAAAIVRDGDAGRQVAGRDRRQQDVGRRVQDGGLVDARERQEGVGAGLARTGPCRGDHDEERQRAPEKGLARAALDGAHARLILPKDELPAQASPGRVSAGGCSRNRRPAAPAAAVRWRRP